MTTPLIELRNVSRRYDGGPPALEDISLVIESGEAVAILGPSGSGKSSLLNLIAGLDRPSSGTVMVDGVHVDRLNETEAARYRRSRIGMIFQFFNLLDDLTAIDNVLLPAQLSGMSRGTARDRAKELLDMLGVGRHAHAYPGRLSGGERQRVAVARALINRPTLLLADEPTGALDTASGKEVAQRLIDLHLNGQTLVVVTHDLALARACATRVVRLVDGSLVEDVRAEAAQ